jgi:polycystin 1L2
MRGKLSYIQGNLSLLKEMNWVDRQTRAVLIEFSAYNPNINLVMVSTILVEFLSSGSLLTMAKFDPLNLFGESGALVSYKTISKLILVTFIAYFLVVEIIKISNMNLKEYMSDFMTYIDCSIIITACISCAMILVRLRAAEEVLDFFKQTGGYGYMKLQNVNDCNQTLTYSLGLCAALGTIKFLKMLRFNRNIAFLGKTLNYCLNELISCSLMFFIIWIAFVQELYFIYNNDLREYASLVKSMESAFLILLGKFDSKKFLFTNAVLGTCVFAAYNVFILWFSLNIFVSIITGSFEKVRHEAKENPEDDFVYMYKYVVEKWINYFKKNSSSSSSSSSFSKNEKKVSCEIYTERLSNFNDQIDRLIDILTSVIY